MAKTKSAEEPKGRPAPTVKDGAPGAAAKAATTGGAAKPGAGKATESRGAPAPADPPAVKEAAVSPRARKAAAEKAKEPPTKRAAAKAPARKGVAVADARRAGDDLRADLRAFAEGRPQGWDHADWLVFLDHLRERGHDTADADAIGLMLERERLAALLERVQGMGPKRVQGIVERYDTIWSAHHASVDELAALPGMNLSLAEKVRQALR
jgi:hypothetical protein